MSLRGREGDERVGAVRPRQADIHAAVLQRIAQLEAQKKELDKAAAEATRVAKAKTEAREAAKLKAAADASSPAKAAKKKAKEDARLADMDEYAANKQVESVTAAIQEARAAAAADADGTSPQQAKRARASPGSAAADTSAPMDDDTPADTVRRVCRAVLRGQLRCAAALQRSALTRLPSAC